MPNRWRNVRATGKDPLLGTAAHRRNRKHWQRLRLPCAVRGRAIDYDGPNLINGRQNPRALVVGHIISRYEAMRMGWPESRINSLANTRPECRACSNKSGAQLGFKVQQANAKVKTGRTDRDRW